MKTKSVKRNREEKESGSDEVRAEVVRKAETKKRGVEEADQGNKHDMSCRNIVIIACMRGWPHVVV